jgi:hypothetical protein
MHGFRVAKICVLTLSSSHYLTVNILHVQSVALVGIFHVLIAGVSFATSRISSSTSGVVELGYPLLATLGVKFPCSRR